MPDMNKIRKALVEKIYQMHKSAFEDWNEGEPKNARFDVAGALCIRYESGKWWHYRLNNGNLSWW